MRLAQNVSDQRTASPQNPEMWHVAVSPGTGIIVEVWAGSGAGGASFFLGGGGKAKIPANGDTVSVRNSSLAAVTAVIICTALRGSVIRYFDVSPGDLA